MLELWPGVWECEYCFQEGVSHKIVLHGSTPSGKNAVVVTRTGHRFPNARFTTWRADAMQQIHERAIYFGDKKIVDSPVNCIVKYWAKDRIRRDAPGIQDALWHLLEKSGIVSDDRWLGGEGKKALFWFKAIDKKNPRVEIYLC
jgi:hypothetical protein